MFKIKWFKKIKPFFLFLISLILLGWSQVFIVPPAFAEFCSPEEGLIQCDDFETGDFSKWGFVGSGGWEI